MGGVVLDTNTIVRAILSPAGARRKLWLLLVYGGAVERARLIRHEHQAARAAGASDTGALEAAANDAEVAATHIARLLPPDAPHDRWAIASPPLLAEYHRKLHDLRDKLATPPWTAAQIDVAYRALVAGCGDITPDFEVDEVPHYTNGRDRDDDAIIHTALIGGAELLISNDTKDISLDRDGETGYGDGEGRTVQAMTFEHFATTRVDLDLDTIRRKPPRRGIPCWLSRASARHNLSCRHLLEPKVHLVPSLFSSGLILQLVPNSEDGIGASRPYSRAKSS